MTKSVSFQVWTLVALIGHFSIHTRLLGWHSLKRCKMLLKDHAVVVNWPASILFLLSSSLAYSFFICQMTFSWSRLFYFQFFPRIERYNDDSQLLLAPSPVSYEHGGRSSLGLVRRKRWFFYGTSENLIRPKRSLDVASSKMICQIFSFSHLDAISRWPVAF